MITAVLTLLFSKQLNPNRCKIMNTNKTLKNCPFCGNEAKIYVTTVDDYDYYSPICTKCDCCLDGNYYTADEAETAWNRRNYN